MRIQPHEGRKKADFGDFFFLAYLIFFFLEPLERRSALHWIECLGVLAVFLGLYVSFVYTRSESRRRLLVLGIFLLGIATMPLNPSGGTCFLIYTASLVAYTFLSLPWMIALIVFVIVVMAGEERLVHYSLSTMFFTCFFAVISGGANLLFAQRERANCKLRMQQEEIEALAAVAERERIARDLHDVLGHTLSLIVLKAELAGRLLDANGTPGTERARGEIGDVERTARTALAEVREAIGGYRSKGLLAEIDAAKRTLEAAGVTLDADAVAAKTAGLSASEETVLSLALREAVTNIVRHAQATKCSLRFASEHGHRRLIVEDDGQHAVLREGNGLRGMRERVEALGGNVQLENASGTRLMVELPLTAEGAVL